MKKLVSVFLVLMLLLSALPMGLFSITASAETVDYDDFDIYDGILVEYLGPGGDVVIPATDADGNPVTEIDSKAFYDNDDITSVVIPEGITWIGSEAFSFCDYLETVKLPSTLQKCRISVFRMCTALKNITIPAKLKDVPQDFCSGCTSLAEVVISYGVETIGGYAFSGLKSLESIVFPETVTDIYGLSMANSKMNVCNVTICNPNCSLGYMGYAGKDGREAPFSAADGANTTWNFFVPEDSKVLEILQNLEIERSRLIVAQSGYFENLPENQIGYGIPSDDPIDCYKYTVVDGEAVITDVMHSISGDITIPSTLGGYPVTIIGSYAFNYCDEITSITIPSSVIGIGISAFGFCTGLEKVSIGKNVQSIGEYAFSHCENLESIAVPNNVKTIEDFAFSHCYKLKEIKIPANVKSVGVGAVVGCRALESLVVEEGNTVYYSKDNCIIKKSNNELVAGCKSSVIPNNIKTIGRYAFAVCQELNGITIPDSVTSIGVSAFAFCENLESIVIGSGVKRIEEFAFEQCNKLSVVKFKGNKNNLYIAASGNDVLKTTTWYYVGCGNHKYSNNCDASCNVCGATRTAPHSYKTSITKATTSKNGKIVKTCSGCKKKVTSTIYYAKSFSLSKTSFTYNGKVQTPTVTVKDAKGKVIDPKYYTLSYSSGRKNVGTYKVTIKLKGNYSGSKTLSYKINPISISKCKVSISGTSYTYNGKTIKPSVKVLSAGGSTLKNGTHYTVTYSKGCKAPGTYKVTVKMKGSYSGSKTFTYKINPISISKCKVSISGTSYYYNGKVIKPSVKVQTASGSTLKNGTHYTVSYSSGCKNPGTYKVVVKMKGTYSGSKTFTYTIKPQIKISTCKVSLSSTAYTYNGKTQTPSVKVVNAEGTTLKNGTHYTVSYSSGRKNIGTYKVTVKMKGIYTGSKTLTYKINPISISKCKVSISATSYTYDGKAKTPSITVKTASGTTLKKDTHYTVSYSSGRINVGTYKVTVKMKGTYSGSQTFTFDILPPKTSITSLVENGKTVKVDFAKKTTQVTGYEIQYATAADFTDALTMTIADYNTTSATITELKSGATYYVRVRTYKTVNGVNYYSGWSTVKSINTTGFLPDNNAGWIPGWY